MIMPDDVRDALTVLGGTPVGILQQEAAGQQALGAGDLLPQTLHGVTREQLTALGFWWGRVVDAVFTEGSLPPGWQKRATEHAYWTEIVDTQGRIRGKIFYKAASYDRSAFLVMECRLRVARYEDAAPGWCAVTILEEQTALAQIGQYAADDWATQDRLGHEAHAWLDCRYPAWRDPLAYWDGERNAR